MMQLFKGKKEIVVDDTYFTHMFDKILSRLDDIQDTLNDMSDKIRDVEERVSRIGAPAEKLQHELVDAKAQVKQTNEFMQRLVMQLIEAPRTVEVPKAPSTALANYIAKKNGEDKPKLP